MIKKILLLAIFGLSNRFNAQIYFPPTTGNDWDTLSPESQGYCQERIDSLYAFLENTSTDGFILLKHGKVVLEKYFGSFTESSLHTWNSASKSLTAFQVLMAQQNGLLNINNSVSSYLGNGWSSASIAQENAITCKQLLQMMSGLDDLPSSPCDQLSTTANCLQYLAPAGTRWSYHTGAYKKLQDVIAIQSGLTYNQYTNNYIEATTGMSGVWTIAGVEGIYISKLRDMARFSSLMLNQGTWNTTPLLTDAVAFNAMISPSQSFNNSYGYLWWLNNGPNFMAPTSQVVIPGKIVPDAPNEMISALGKDDQKIYIIPSQKLAVVRMGGSAYNSFALSPYDNDLWQKINALTCNVELNELEEIKLTVFPNPANNTIHFKSNFLIHEIKVFTCLGEIKIITNQAELNTSDLSNGLYFAEIATDTGVIQIRFEVIH